MKNLLIFALFLLIACSDEKLSSSKYVEVTFSPANPVQFWLNDCDTYNETIPKGVHYKCFCHRWKCSDEIPTQFIGDSDTDYSLRVLDEDDNLIDEVSLTESLLLANDPDLNFQNREFSVNILSWTNVSTSPDQQVFAWAGGGVARADATSSMYETTQFLSQGNVHDVNGWPPGNYTMQLRARNASFGDADPIGLIVYGIDGGAPVSIQSIASVPRDSQFHIYEVNFSTDQYWPSFAFRFIRQGGGGTFRIIADFDYIRITNNSVAYESVYSGSFIPEDIGACEQKIRLEVIEPGSPEEVSAKTDCLDITDSEVDPSALISYSSPNNVAGLIFENVSPQQVFNIRIPAVFFHEDFPQEDEVARLSNKVIKLNSQITAKKRLDTDFMPYYMHLKLQTILSMPLLEIDGVYWTKQDAYSKDDGSKRWPVKSASVWLTRRDFLQRQVI